MSTRFSPEIKAPYVIVIKRLALVSSIKLGKIFGIPIGVHYSWFFIFVLLTTMLVRNVFPDHWSNTERIVTAVATSVLFFASVVAHELSHSLVAIKKGIPVARITLFVFGGVAQITKEPTKPGDEVQVAAAGPAMSLLLGGLFLVIYLVFNHINEQLSTLSLWLGFINIQLAVFNLIPGFPLDGGRIFRGITWKLFLTRRLKKITGIAVPTIDGKETANRESLQKATRVASNVGRVIAWLFIGAGLTLFIVDREFSWLWIAFIGWFLENASKQAYSQMRFRNALNGLQAHDVMSSDFVMVAQQTNIKDLVDNFIYLGAHSSFVVSLGQNALGMLSLRDIRSLPKDKWLTTNAGQIMTPVGKLPTVKIDEDAVSVMEKLESTGYSRLLVLENGVVMGIVTHESVQRWLQPRLMLGSQGR
ncbi:MAG: site-2 protease family protein [Dehalococcoidia bacterium]|nr:site-2 protease family protein [Dehalococcoidia bacterium]